MYNGASWWGQAFNHWCLAVFFVEYTWLYKGVTFCVLVVLPSLPPFWLDLEMLSMCLLFCFVIFGYYVVMCEKIKNKKLLITKKNIHCLNRSLSPTLCTTCHSQYRKYYTLNKWPISAIASASIYSVRGGIRILKSIWLVRRFDEKLKYEVTSKKIVDPFWRKWRTASIECLYLLNPNFVTVLKHTGL